MAGVEAAVSAAGVGVVVTGGTDMMTVEVGVAMVVAAAVAMVVAAVAATTTAAGAVVTTRMAGEIAVMTIEGNYRGCRACAVSWFAN